MKNGTEIIVRPNWSVPHNQLKKVESLKVYRQGSEFTEYTTGNETYAEHMSGKGVEKAGEYQVFRVCHAQFLTGVKINRVV